MPSRRLVVASVVALALILGFAVATVTGVRWLGGLVLLGAGLWCAWRLWPVAGVWRTVVIAIVYVVAFAVSHPLGHVIGTWPSVIVVAVVAGVVAYVLGIGPGSSRVSTTSP
jgi:hypothetical protein